jgi:hypothetical protein
MGAYQRKQSHAKTNVFGLHDHWTPVPPDPDDLVKDRTKSPGKRHELIPNFRESNLLISREL